MLKRALMISLLLFIWGALIPAAQEADASGEKVFIKFATLAPEGSSWMKAMRRLDRSLIDKSNGLLRFRIYPGGVAGDELDVLRKIRIGQLQCAAFSGVGFGQILPEVRVLDLPFLFRDYRETDLAHEALFPYFSRRFREMGFELLAWAEVGNVHLFSKKPIRRVSDLAELRVWTWSGDPIARETLSAMGTNPIPLSVTDVTTALNTGMIDTVYAPPLGALALQWQRYLNFMTSLPMVHATGAILISKPFLDAIPEPLSAILKDGIREAMADLTRELREQGEESIELIKKGGLTVLPPPSADDLQGFLKVHGIVAERLAGKIYPRELLDRVYDILKRRP